MGVSRTHAGIVGETIQTQVTTGHDQLEHVPEGDADWHDALTVDAIGADHRLVLRDRVSPDTPVEIKGCKLRIANNGTTRRGHWHIKRRAHERLLDSDGVYYLVVYCADSPGDVEPVHEAVVPADVVDEAITTWTTVESRGNEITRIPWSRLFDPDDVEGGGQT